MSALGEVPLMSTAEVLALLKATSPEDKKVASDAQRRITSLSTSLEKMETTTSESFRICEQLTKRARHLDSLTSPASDASALLSEAAGNLQNTLTLMKDAREKFDTVSDCEPAIERLHQGVTDMEEARKGHSSTGKNPFDLDTGVSIALSEQDVYAAADNMEILKDAFDYFLEHKHWRSAPTTLGSLERVHKLGVTAMCILMTHHLMSAGQAIRLKRVVKKETPTKEESAEETRARLTVALQNRDLMKSIGEYEEHQPIEARPVREMRAVLECLSNDGYHLGPPRKREPSALITSYGVPANKVVRTEKVGSGGYTNIVKKSLRSGFPQLDAYGEARKQVAWKAVEGYYRRLKAERKKNALEESPADTAARDAVRCLEHAMVVVAGEKSVYRAILAPSAAKAEEEDAPFVAPFYQKGCVTAFSHVAAGVVDRTMDIIETVFFKEAGIGQSSKEGSVLSIPDAAAGAAAGLRMLDGIRILGPSLAKLCEIPLNEKATVNVKSGTMPVASTLCIAIHRTTVKNTARTLENLAKAIQEDPTDGEAHRPADGGVCAASMALVKAIRLISPFLDAYKSVTKRRALPWDPNIGEEAGEMDSYIKYLVMRIRNSLASKATNYANDPSEIAQARAHLFMVNNTYYLLRQLRPSAKAKADDAENYRIEGSWFENDIKKVFEAERSKYLSFWEVLNTHLVMLEEKASNSVSNEGARLLKVRFHGFNEELERIHPLHGGLLVADSSLRKNMQKEVSNVFLPNYRKFYDRYATVKFSKKKQEEYVRFTPETVEEMIGQLFRTPR